MGRLFFSIRHTSDKERIWELDALRGLCILGMMVVHLLYDLVDLFGIVSWDYPAGVSLVMRWGGVLFFIISGICANFSRHSVRRGVIVFGCGMLCSAVTAGMYFLQLADSSILIYFGVLHCLGCCMLLWPVLKKLPDAVMALFSLLIIATGLYLRTIAPASTWLFIPLGILRPGFVSSDYFPLLPYAGFFLLGCILGRVLYPCGKSRFPHARTNTPVVGTLCFLGRHSLMVYLLHQPVLAGLVWILFL